MPNYCSLEDVLSEINGADLIAFLDDNDPSQPGYPGPGMLNTNLLNDIIARESAKIDGRLATIYPTPFNPAPARVRDACTTLVCSALYKRRLVPREQNPFAAEEAVVVDELKRIGNGELDLDVSYPRAFAQGAFLQQPLAMIGNSL